MSLLFVIMIIVGFLAKFLATYPVNYAERIAWGCWLVASILWAWGRLA